jgi:ribose/xylose/arabinose/galactoside ABC-type transport system permease subunit
MSAQDGSAPGQSHAAALLWRFADRLGALAILIVILIGMSIAYADFVTVDNMLTIGVQATTRAILAIGVTLVIISGGIDLSVGTGMSLCMVVLGMFCIVWEYPLWLGCLAAIGTGAVIGLVNGAIIAFGSLPPFIATLGMLGIAQGVALMISQGYSMYGFPPEFEFVAAGNIAGVPVPLLILAVIGLLMAYVYKQTRLGRYAYAIGGSEEASRRSGIGIRGTKIALYVSCGALAGAASIVLASRVSSAQPGSGFGYELDAIAAAVIGGASLQGGRGTVGGAIIGAIIMATIRFGLNVLGMQAFVQQIVIGVILIAAVYLDILRTRQEVRLSRLRAH